MIRKIKTHIAKIIIFFVLTVMFVIGCSISIVGIRESENVKVGLDQENSLDSLNLLGGEEIEIGTGNSGARREKQKDTITKTDTIHATK